MIDNGSAYQHEGHPRSCLCNLHYAQVLSDQIPVPNGQGSRLLACVVGLNTTQEKISMCVGSGLQMIANNHEIIIHNVCCCHPATNHGIDLNCAEYDINTAADCKRKWFNAMKLKNCLSIFDFAIKKCYIFTITPSGTYRTI